MFSGTARNGLATALVLAGMALAATAPVRAESIQKTCGNEWKAAKAAGQVAAGTTWPKFLSECRTRHANDATAPATETTAPTTTPTTAPQPAATAPEPPHSAAETAPAPSKGGGREAMVARERQCGKRWKEIKGTPALPAGITTWPKYWSWCNKKLKAGETI
jgi:hypothetical protein